MITQEDRDELEKMSMNFLYFKNDKKSLLKSIIIFMKSALGDLA